MRNFSPFRFTGERPEGNGMTAWKLERLKSFAICRLCRAKIINASGSKHLRDKHGLRLKTKEEVLKHLQIVQMKGAGK
jgi:hypothetical protein